MKRILYLPSLLFFLISTPTFSQDGGKTEALFKTKCAICHTIGGGRLVGPDLANVQDSRSEDWLLSFIRSTQSMIKSGDPDAVALFEEYNQVIMPDPMISDTEIKSILDYIKEKSRSIGQAVEYISIIGDATPEDQKNGEDLFEGRVRFANGGPSCISCHNGQSDIFFSENSFSSKDLSASFTNLGEAGVKAILENPPFPVMTQAFEGHELTEAEIHDLLVFLQNSQKPKSDVASGYLLYGVLGAGGLLLLYAGFWYERKNRSVNHDIYRRQIKSFN